MEQRLHRELEEAALRADAREAHWRDQMSAALTQVQELEGLNQRMQEEIV